MIVDTGAGEPLLDIFLLSSSSFDGRLPQDRKMWGNFTFHEHPRRDVVTKRPRITILIDTYVYIYTFVFYVRHSGENILIHFHSRCVGSNSNNVTLLLA